MRRSLPLTADQANEVQRKWDKADGEGRKKLLATFTKMPQTYIAVSGPGTGTPIAGSCPFGGPGYSFEEASATLGMLNCQPTTPFLYRNHWYATQDDLPQEVRVRR